MRGPAGAVGAPSQRGGLCFYFFGQLQPALFQGGDFIGAGFQATATVGNLGGGQGLGQALVQGAALGIQGGHALVDLLQLAFERAQLLCQQLACLGVLLALVAAIA